MADPQQADPPEQQADPPEQQAQPAAVPQPDGPPKQRGGFSRSILKVAKSRWGKIRGAASSIFKALALAKEDTKAFKMESKQALLLAQLGLSDVKLEVSSAKELQKINYMQQGNVELCSEEMLQKRHNLRSDPAIIEAVKQWWRWLPKDGAQGEKESTSIILTKPVYCAMVVVIQLVLLPRFNMEPDLSYDPEEDWLDDNKGLDVMSFPDFFDAMFELADMWCDVVSGDAYTELLNGLLADAKASGQMDKLLKRFGWTPSQQVPEGPKPAMAAASPSVTQPVTPQQKPPARSAPAPHHEKAPAPTPHKKLEPLPAKATASQPAAPAAKAKAHPAAPALPQPQVPHLQPIKKEEHRAPAPPGPSRPAPAAAALAPKPEPSKPAAVAPAPVPRAEPRPAQQQRRQELPSSQPPMPAKQQKEPEQAEEPAPFHDSSPAGTDDEGEDPPSLLMETAASGRKSAPALPFPAGLGPPSPPPHGLRRPLPPLQPPTNHHRPFFMGASEPPTPSSVGFGFGMVEFDAPQKHNTVTTWHSEFMKALVDKRGGGASAASGATSTTGGGSTGSSGSSGASGPPNTSKEASGAGHPAPVPERPSPTGRAGQAGGGQGRARRASNLADKGGGGREAAGLGVAVSSSMEYWDASCSSPEAAAARQPPGSPSPNGRQGSPGRTGPAGPVPASPSGAKSSGIQMQFQKPSNSQQQGYYAGPLGLFQAKSRTQDAGPWQQQQQQEREQQWREQAGPRPSPSAARTATQRRSSAMELSGNLPHSKYPSSTQYHSRPSSPSVAAPFKLSSPAFHRGGPHSPPQRIRTPPPQQSSGPPHLGVLAQRAKTADLA